MNVTPEMMGSIVTVCAELKREVGTVNDKDFAEWVSKPIKARAGWIVGVRAKKNGIIVGSSLSPGSFEEGPDVDPGYLSVKSVTRAVMVCFWPTMNAVPVPVDAITPGGTPLSPSAYFNEIQRTQNPEEHARWLAVIREESKSFPRDNKGKFCKYEPITVAT